MLTVLSGVYQCYLADVKVEDTDSSVGSAHEQMLQHLTKASEDAELPYALWLAAGTGLSEAQALDLISRILS
jgi:hypothetical protein